MNMNVKQALQFIFDCAGAASLPKQTHVACDKSYKIILDYINQKEQETKEVKEQGK